MRVATINLWGRHGAWDERRPVLIDGFRRLQPDLVAFEEAVVGDGYDQATDILGTGYHVAHQAGRETDGTGLSIASRWEVGKVWSGSLGKRGFAGRTPSLSCTSAAARWG